MTIRLLESARSALTPMEYNENKFWKGEATVVAVGNLPDDLPSTIREAFELRESHPATSRRLVHAAFHMAFNPGADDSITREQVPECISELMDMIGYGGQPYVVYRHNDIEREHYHVVSSNILPNGKATNNDFLFVRLNRAGAELGKKYGFVMGRKEKKAAPVRSVGELMGPALRIVPSAPIKEQLTATVRRAHEFDYGSYNQFLAVLDSFGIRAMAKKRKNGKWGLSAYIYDADGNKVSRLYALDHMLRQDIVGEFRSRMKAGGTQERREDAVQAAMTATASLCLGWAESLKEYRSMLRERGLEVSVMRKDDGELLDVCIVDKTNGRVDSLPVMNTGLGLKTLRRKYDSVLRNDRDAPAPRKLTEEQHRAVDEAVRLAVGKAEEEKRQDESANNSESVSYKLKL